MPRQRLALSLLPVLITLFLSSLSFADSPAARPFAPTQDGFSRQAENVLPYAPDRLLVKLTAQGMSRSNLNLPDQLGAVVPGAETGLASVDAISRDVGVTKISRAFIQPANRSLSDQLGVHRVLRFELPQGEDIPAMAERFAADPNVEYATPDWRAFPAAIPNDPYHDDNWGHNNTAQLPDLDWGGTYDHTLPNTVGTPGFDSNAQVAWDGSQGFGSASVIIAIIDSGVDIDHDDLRLVAGYDYGSGDSNPDDNSGAAGHGTCCAGIAAAIVNNAMEVNGAAGGCSVMPLKVANNAGSMYFSSIVNAIYHAADNGADILSMSLGAYLDSDASTDAALQYAYNAGCVSLAATSNDNYSYTSYPACNQHTIAVGAASPCGERKRSSSNSAECNPGVATDPNGYTCDGERWWGSNYGLNTQDNRKAVDILGPTILPTTDIEGSGGYRSGDVEPFFNGTSCATPYVAGVCALIKSKNPSWTAAQIRDQLVTSAQDVISVESGAGWDRYSGYGMVDAAAAVGGGGPVVPTADFVGNPISGTEPLNVSFTDLSSGGPTSWSWTFGDGGTSTAQNPDHTYNNAGTYTVTLNVSNAAGSDGETKTNYITVTTPPPPTANFAGDPTSGVYPLDVSFTDMSTDSPTSWNWNFGDSGTSTLQNPSHTYAAAGTYTVTLTATNAYGSDDEIKTDYITVTEPGVTTFVTASGETSVIGTVSGNYIDTKISDDVRETITEEIYTGHPRKRYSYLQHEWNFDVPAGGDVTFHLEASRTANSEGDNFAFEYSTDGVNWLPLVTVASSTEQPYTTALGTLSGTVTVRVMDTNRSWGNLALDALAVDYLAFEVGDAQPQPPTADFIGTPTIGDYPLTVTFTDASTGDPTSWSWTFGDGGTSTAQNPQHTYTAAGAYTVALTATNAHGSDPETKMNYITVTEPGQGGTLMHVHSMAVSRFKVGPNYIGTCVVTVHDDNGQPVSDATVYASYDGPNSGAASGVTGGDGTVTLESAGKKKPSGEWCFEVTNITHASLAYDAGSNVATRVCESGTVYRNEYKTAIPAEFGLDQNRPNPFNPKTDISFRLPRDASVRLRIYDIRGRIVETLVDQVLSAGAHTATWNAPDAASGIYFYRLETPYFSKTHRMLLLK